MADDHSGYISGLGGDVDGDGYDDVFIGAPQNDFGGSNAGAAYLLYGPVEAGAGLVDAEATIVGEAVEDWAGYSISHAGDLNGDGSGDVLIGAYGNDAGGSNAGAAYILCGPVFGAVDLATADAKLVGEEAEDYAGINVSSAGDVDADGYDDVLVGAWGNDVGGSLAGAVYLLYGGAP